MDLVLIIGLIVLGIFFMILEVYLIPGISVAGVASFVCFVVGIVLAYKNLGPVAGTWILAGSMVSLGAVLYWFLRSKTLDRMALKSEIHSKTEPFQGLEVKPGDTGITISRLAPIGKIKINGKTIEGRSENEMIDQNTPIKVIEVGSYNVLVRKMEE
ncbi:MAG TPA: NfeD family protein [Bacteroidales bacterium]|nr:NfeD family protein [Bacteroidales bacterium]